MEGFPDHYDILPGETTLRSFGRKVIDVITNISFLPAHVISRGDHPAHGAKAMLAAELEAERAVPFEAAFNTSGR